MERQALFQNPHVGKDKINLAEYLQMTLTAKVYDIAIETPLQKSINLSKRMENTILYKREDLQPVFSFKCRGAHNMMAYLSDEQKRNGVIACSAGNHAQGVALAASKMGLPATIVMPSGAPPIKVNAVERMGAQVILFGNDFQDAKAECERLSVERNLPIIPPYDNPFVIAGQGTVAMEILREYDISKIDAIFVCVGGGGLLAGIAAYVKAVCPKIKIIAVQSFDSSACVQSIMAGERIELPKVGLFADGTAVRMPGKETFRLAKTLVDEMVLVDTDEICAAIRDVFEDTRSILEPSGALSVAGAKKYIKLTGSKNNTFVTICSGANMNFDRLRFVADRAGFGQNTEALISVVIPERPSSFLEMYQALGPCEVTGFSYRFGDTKSAIIFMSLKINANTTVEEIIARLKESGMTATDATHDELSKTHIRYLIGGRKNVADERLFRFSFPERPGALGHFLNSLKNPLWNISLFHYRNYGGDVGKVMVGIQVPQETKQEFNLFLAELKYPYVEETENILYKQFLQ